MSWLSFGCNHSFYKELQKDNELREKQGEEFLPVDFHSLMNKLPDGIPIYYVGTNETDHFFIYYYDAWTKMVMKYRVKKEEYSPNKIISKEDLLIRNYPLYPEKNK